jgi:hypothetical protein
LIFANTEGILEGIVRSEGTRCLWHTSGWEQRLIILTQSCSRYIAAAYNFRGRTEWQWAHTQPGNVTGCRKSYRSHHGIQRSVRVLPQHAPQPLLTFPTNHNDHETEKCKGPQNM